ncbi:polysaccharide export protein [Methylobacterium nodulans ORS 2060]|uniref:Polysaccharide export protein n=2 Tax=Methylobacterium nodulans TaxID=114616 RepID=B8IHE5_METNO|nr:polysaccharide export protein [Methylobacterium nodulans ORS 2060]
MALTLGFSSGLALGAFVAAHPDLVRDASGPALQKVLDRIYAISVLPETVGAAKTLVSDRKLVSPAAGVAQAQPTARPSLVQTASAVASDPETAEPTAKAVGAAANPPAGTPIGVGDRLKLAFYERLDVEEDKWGRAASAMKGIQQRPELSGEYAVQEDGTIMVPLLGQIPAAGRRTAEIQAALAKAFSQALGRKGLVNILALERSPVYVLGLVKNPGSYKYASGMTVMHALALAGGLERAGMEPWQKLEAVREVEKRNGATQTILKLLARVAVLRAERDGTQPKIPLKLVELIGASEARSFISGESERRKAIAQTRRNREVAIAAALDAERQALDMMKGRLGPIDDLVRLRQERVNSMKALVSRNILANTVVNQVLSELSDAEQRRQEALNQYSMASARLSSLEQEANRIRAENKSDLQTEIDVIERSLTDAEREINTSHGILSSLTTSHIGSGGQKGVTYEIVRQTAAGPISIMSDGMTVLQPGDLVNVDRSADSKDEALPSEPNVAVPTSDQVDLQPHPSLPVRPRT